ncbi:hypothetical protein P3H15_15135 [Rhodococcus sp. T2V]|uniref:hypothetical protein n=1 Tax=Rhodococcus sp. T2V TaxID=3034164 RepID=UPI0023E1C569|nr:hypothetical protein [Rhodococcus sp. T2V]MDF3306362.1 hypothetical protein [Rhodococcus sp. T2V]
MRSAHCVEVTFEKSHARRFDLVFGADGIHSAVRKHRFGPEQDFVRFLGYYFAVVGTTDAVTAASPDRDRATGWMYNEPGRMAVVGGPKAPELFVFASDPIDYDRGDITEQKRLLAAAYAGAGWRVPGLLAHLDDAPDFYLDSIARVEADTYTAGRVALLGDAAYGNTLGGFGTGLALVGAHVLAGRRTCRRGWRPRGVRALQRADAPVREGRPQGQRWTVSRAEVADSHQAAELDVQVQGPVRPDDEADRLLRHRHRPAGLPGAAISWVSRQC